MKCKNEIKNQKSENKSRISQPRRKGTRDSYPNLVTLVHRCSSAHRFKRPRINFNKILNNSCILKRKRWKKVLQKLH